MKRDRNGKIIATVGPAARSPESLEKLYLSGVDAFRLNFSHGSRDDHAKTYEAIRSIGRKYRVSLAILADLQGAKLRIGGFKDDKIVLKKGDDFRFDLDQAVGTSQRVYFPHPEVFEIAQVGTLLLLDDGKLKFEVISRGRDYVDTRVLVGGELSGEKGVHVPSLKLPSAGLTKKDTADMNFALDLGVDWIVLSMIQSVEDVERAKKIIGGRAGVMSKLETRRAVDCCEPIIEASDAIMIGRGDLGVEIDLENVPSVQRKIVETCRRLGRPTIVATQMLESMITSPTPTRAEVSDVATAIYQRADAVMLSAESAVGQYPFEAAKTMSRIIQKTELDLPKVVDEASGPRKSVTDAICSAAKEAAEYSDANAIVLFTDSFATALRCSRLKPRAPIILVTDSITLASKIGICNGIYAVIAKKEFDIEQMCKTARSIVAERQFATAGDNIVVVNDVSGNSVTLCRVDANKGIV